jgi:hypothetical protein
MNWQHDYDQPERFEGDEPTEQDATPSNGDRATYANAAVDAYYLRTRHELGPVIGDTDDWAETISDLLCDLHHLADLRGVEWRAAWDRGTFHYLAEIGPLE